METRRIETPSAAVQSRSPKHAPHRRRSLLVVNLGRDPPSAQRSRLDAMDAQLRASRPLLGEPLCFKPEHWWGPVAKWVLRFLVAAEHEVHRAPLNVVERR
jgi:hypothetical protein